MSSAMPLRERAGRAGVSVARALGSSTRAGIFAHLQTVQSSCTVRDIAAAFDLHPNVARTHLELLADAGLVTIGRRKHPGGGRPAKVYTAREGAPPLGGAGSEEAPADPSEATRLLVRLLVALAEDRQVPPPAGRTGNAALNVRAYEVAAAEGRKLMGEGASSHEGGGGSRAAVDRTVATLRWLAPDVRVARSGDGWFDVAGLREMFEVLEDSRPALADHLTRGLLAGALGASGLPVTVGDGGEAPDGVRLVRVRAVPPAASRGGARPASMVDARGGQREAGVVRAMRAVTNLEPGDVLEVLAEGPGSPAAFARWADRAGHQLLGVERVTDAAGRPAIRLLIRKGS